MSRSSFQHVAPNCCKKKTPVKGSPVLLEGSIYGGYWHGLNNRRRVKAKRPTPSTSSMPPPVSKKPKITNYGDDDVETDLAFSQFHDM